MRKTIFLMETKEGGKMKREINFIKKSDAIYEAIKDSKIGDKIILHNPDGSISLILKVIAKEREDDNDNHSKNA